MEDDNVVLFDYENGEFLDFLNLRLILQIPKTTPIRVVDLTFDDRTEDIIDKLNLENQSKSQKFENSQNSQNLHFQTLYILLDTVLISYKPKTQNIKFSKKGIFGEAPLTRLTTISKHLAAVGTLSGNAYIVDLRNLQILQKLTTPTSKELQFSRIIGFSPFYPGGEGTVPLIAMMDKMGKLVCWSLNSADIAYTFKQLNNNQESHRCLKGEKPSEIFYEKKFNFFVVLTNLSITLWNCYTGLLVAKVHLRGEEGFVKGMLSICALADENSISTDLMIGDSEGRVFRLILKDSETMKLRYDGTSEILNLGENFITALKTTLMLKGDDIMGVRDGTWMDNARILIIKKNGISIVEKISKGNFPHKAKLAKHPMYYTRIANNLVKELTGIDGVPKKISKKNLKLILNCELEDINTERQNLLPKLLYLRVVGVYITCNVLEFFEEESGDLNYMVYSTVLYTNDTPIDSPELRVSRNGKYISLLDFTRKKCKILKVGNQDLVLDEGNGPTGIEYVHPLGSLEKIYEVNCDRIFWNSDMSQFACRTFSGLNIGDDTSTEIPYLTFYAVNEKNSKIFKIHQIDLGVEFELYGGCLISTFYKNQEDQSMCQFHQCTRKGPVSTAEIRKAKPVDIKWSNSHEICVFIYSNYLDINVYHSSSDNTETTGFRLKQKYKEKNFDSKILSLDFWQDMLIVFTQLSIYCIIPKLFSSSEVLMVRIASYENTAKIQKINLQGELSLLNIIDHSLIVLNDQNQIQVISLKKHPLVVFYFNLEKNNIKRCYEIASQAKNIKNQEIFIKLFFEYNEYKLPCMLTTFPAVLTSLYPQIMISEKFPKKIKLEYTRMIISIKKSIQASKLDSIFDSIAKNLSKFSIKEKKQIHKLLKKFEILPQIQSRLNKKPKTKKLKKKKISKTKKNSKGKIPKKK